ncbi:glycerophosphodiester phosphodiesterase family protein [Microbacterium paludicola]|uniref:glycerophosphodiester phosphodiesterase family protein n=1 Tax=Microbacterium paludicola TaxID=300019 RepID=UPI0014304023|nr:glycerophosphodiester phosphodiesterase family protein [Microbacterium paludicola]MBF0817536.1 glycerophosphodiester phosphodiesterase family protein [Microbacterium paludicola]
MSRVLGRPEHAHVNRRFAARLDEVGALIVVHRGVAAGSVAENTIEAVRAALRSGGDIVELDAVASSDGVFFAFHDGMEPVLLGVPHNLATLPAERIRDLRHLRIAGSARSGRVPELGDVLAALPHDALINLDRSWPWWRTLLPWLDEQGVTDRVLLKCWAADEASLALLRAHPEPYPFMPICRTLAEAERILGDKALNTIGLELIATEPDGPFLDADVIARLRDRGVFTMVNAEVLTSGPPLFAGLDDERSLFDDPDDGWGAILDLGIDAIQTDWPWLLHAYQARRAVRV